MFINKIVPLYTVSDLDRLIFILSRHSSLLVAILDLVGLPLFSMVSGTHRVLWLHPERG